MKTLRGKSKEFYGANCIKVTVGVDSHYNGDQGVTILDIRDTGGTGWEVLVQDGSHKGRYFNPTAVTLVFHGTSELENLIKALKFAYESLDQLKKENDDIEGRTVDCTIAYDDREIRIE